MKSGVAQRSRLGPRVLKSAKGLEPNKKAWCLRGWDRKINSRGILNSICYIRKLYLSPIHLVDPASSWSTLIYFTVLLIHIWVPNWLQVCSDSIPSKLPDLDSCLSTPSDLDLCLSTPTRSCFALIHAQASLLISIIVWVLGIDLVSLWSMPKPVS